MCRRHWHINDSTTGHGSCQYRVDGDQSPSRRFPPGVGCRTGWGAGVAVVWSKQDKDGHKPATFAAVGKLTLLATGFALGIAFAPVASATPIPLPQGSDCDSNYDPCVPIDSDVDCAGGSGNGPSYVAGPVRVVGDDIYELDREGDGIACEPTN